MKKHKSGEPFSFRLPTLARTTYKKLQEHCEETKLSQWEIVTMAIHLFDDRRKAKDNVLLKRIREETKQLTPESGKRKIDQEHESQTREENGEDWQL